METEVRGLYYSVAHFIVGHPKCGRLHGHSYGVTARVRGKQSGQYRFVGGLDFQVLKDALNKIIDTLDHRVLVPVGLESDTVTEMTDGVMGRVAEVVTGAGKMYVFPVEDIAMVAVTSTTAEDMVQWIAEGLAHKLGVKHVDVEIRLDEGPGQSATATVSVA